MEMLLMGLCVSVFGLGVVAVAFRAATRGEPSNPVVQPELAVAEAASPVLALQDRVAAPAIETSRQVPIEVLLLQIENHVRLEQAAAESFIGFPSHTLLHSKTTAKFVN